MPKLIIRTLVVPTEIPTKVVETVSQNKEPIITAQRKTRIKMVAATIPQTVASRSEKPETPDTDRGAYGPSDRKN